MIDDTLNQVNNSSHRYDDRNRGSYGRENDVDDLIYRISRDFEELRIKNCELNVYIADLEMQSLRLKDIMRNRRY